MYLPLPVHSHRHRLNACLPAPLAFPTSVVYTKQSPGSGCFSFHSTHHTAKSLLPIMMKSLRAPPLYIVQAQHGPQPGSPFSNQMLCHSPTAAVWFITGSRDPVFYKYSWGDWSVHHDSSDPWQPLSSPRHRHVSLYTGDPMIPSNVRCYHYKSPASCTVSSICYFI